MPIEEKWKGFVEHLYGYEELIKYFEAESFENWIFRGQYLEWKLETALERACENSGLKKKDRPKIEDNMIRQFQRTYDGSDQNEVKTDTLYCLSVLQHYGGPTRLLDFTYSKYVGIYFATEYANDNKLIDNQKCFAIWCINTKWLDDMEKAFAKIDSEAKNLIKQRREDDNRNDDTYKKLYSDKFAFVGWENPLGLHKRLHLQQGVFLCPDNITKPFEKNLKELQGWSERDNVRKVECQMDKQELHKFLEGNQRMNISRESLFPGPDGFAQSMKYQLPYHLKLWHYRHKGKE